MSKYLIFFSGPCCKGLKGFYFWLEFLLSSFQKIALLHKSNVTVVNFYFPCKIVNYPKSKTMLSKITCFRFPAWVTILCSSTCTTFLRIYATCWEKIEPIKAKLEIQINLGHETRYSVLISWVKISDDNHSHTCDTSPFFDSTMPSRIPLIVLKSDWVETFCIKQPQRYLRSEYDHILKQTIYVNKQLKMVQGITSRFLDFINSMMLEPETSWFCSCPSWSSDWMWPFKPYDATRTNK